MQLISLLYYSTSDQPCLSDGCHLHELQSGVNGNHPPSLPFYDLPPLSRPPPDSGLPIVCPTAIDYRLFVGPAPPAKDGSEPILPILLQEANYLLRPQMLTTREGAMKFFDDPEQEEFEDAHIKIVDPDLQFDSTEIVGLADPTNAELSDIYELGMGIPDLIDIATGKEKLPWEQREHPLRPFFQRLLGLESPLSAFESWCKRANEQRDEENAA
ncbi:hypothetical protein AX16_004501 [Volvariella volvacea WC 439]|nr:hypothetical protein AX16_004501 [Volvariella volvacea WC 439]